MRSLLIPDIEDSALRDLQASAASHDRTIEEEAREVLLEAILLRSRTQSGLVADEQKEHIVDLARRLFGPDRGVHLDFPSRGAEPERSAPSF